MNENTSNTPGLGSVIERVEKLTEQKKAILDDIRDVFTEAKLHGFDVKALRAVIRERTQDPKVLAEHRAMVEVYRLEAPPRTA